MKTKNMFTLKCIVSSSHGKLFLVLPWSLLIRRNQTAILKIFIKDWYNTRDAQKPNSNNKTEALNQTTA